MRISHKTLATTIAIGAVFSSSFAIFGADEQSATGIVRISDGQVASPAQLQTAPSCPSCNNASPHFTGTPIPEVINYHGHLIRGGHVNGRRPSRRHTPFHVWLNPIGGNTYSPDHGWSPPGKYPIRRSSVAYQHYLPAQQQQGGAAASTGKPPVYPMIYQPTDTTQLGFYYQHVPQWQPNPSMLPPAPRPGDWHYRPGATANIRYNPHFQNHLHHRRQLATPVVNGRGECKNYNPVWSTPGTPHTSQEILGDDPSGNTTPDNAEPRRLPPPVPGAEPATDSPNNGQPPIPPLPGNTPPLPSDLNKSAFGPSIRPLRF